MRSAVKPSRILSAIPKFLVRRASARSSITQLHQLIGESVAGCGRFGDGLRNSPNTPLSSFEQRHRTS